MNSLPRISHPGVLKFGAMEVECAVLDDGRRGLLGKHFAKALGYAEKTPSDRFSRFLIEFAPNYMNGKEKAGSPVSNPGRGGRAQFIEAEAVVEAIDNVIEAAVEGRTRKWQSRQVAACLAIRRGLGVVGLVSLIDEATGYQYSRAPDALQDLIGRLIRKHVADWERRFEPEYYRALAKLTNTRYMGGGPKPAIWGWITLHYVYEEVFPTEVLAELQARKGESEKLHQWLTDKGIAPLERQIDRVRDFARTSANLADFKARMSAISTRPGQIGLLYPDAA